MKRHTSSRDLLLPRAPLRGFVHAGPNDPIVRYMRANGLTQAAFGRLSGLGRRKVWSYLEGEQRLTPAQAVRVELATAGAITRQELRADFFGVPTHGPRLIQISADNPYQAAALLQQRLSGADFVAFAKEIYLRAVGRAPYATEKGFLRDNAQPQVPPEDSASALSAPPERPSHGTPVAPENQSSDLASESAR